MLVWWLFLCCTSTGTQFYSKQSTLEKVRTVNTCMVLGLEAVVTQMVVL